ncbi:MAG: rhodanese-like domain-containing protein [Pelovirga sp.]
MNNRIVVLCAMLVAALMLGGCAATQPKAMSKDDLLQNRSAMIADARAAVPQITIEQLKQKIDAEEDFFLIDVRDPNEWPIGLVDYENVVTASRGKIEFIAPNRFAVDDPLVVICKTGGRSSLAAKTLHDLGYVNVTNVSTGMDDWMAAGYPLKD